MAEVYSEGKALEAHRPVEDPTSGQFGGATQVCPPIPQ